jgi:hypothetical protein
MYVIALAAIPSTEIRSEFESLYRWDWLGLTRPLVPTLCSEARGVMGKDFEIRETPGICWYELSNFRLRYPEFKNLSDRDLDAKLYTAVGRPLPPTRPTFPWTTLFKWLVTAIGIPLLVLILGAAIGWALSGFGASTSATRRDRYLGD